MQGRMGISVRSIINIRIDPCIISKSNSFGNRIVHTCIPVDNDDDVHNEVRNPEDVWVVCPCFCSLEELKHTRDRSHTKPGRS